MAKQFHTRIGDSIYDRMMGFIKENKLTKQEMVEEAIILYLANANRKEQFNPRFTFIDLFAGIGGMRIAFEKCGGKCVFSSEWDKYCRKTYMNYFGDKPEGDIKQINEDDIPDYDILVGGFPCQPFSLAGVSKKNSLNRSHGFLDKTQGTLFFEIVRILRGKKNRPRAFMLENVKNLKSHNKGDTFDTIKGALETLDYEIFSEVLDGSHFVPQHRERIFIVGFDKQRYNVDQNSFHFPEMPQREKLLSDILENNVDSKYTLTDKLWNYLQAYAEKHRRKGNGFGYGLVDPETDPQCITRTLSARYHKDGSEILIRQKNRNPRRLNPRECARLQGFPEDFDIVVSDTQAYKQFGNSVVVPLVKCVAEELIQTVENLEKRAMKRQVI